MTDKKAEYKAPVKFKVLSDLKHNGISYKPGDSIDKSKLDDKSEARLLKTKVIE